MIDQIQIQFGALSKANFLSVVTIICRVRVRPCSAWLQGEGKTEEMGLGEVGRLAECRGWGGAGGGLDWHCQTEHFNWKPCSEHCIRSGCSPGAKLQMFATAVLSQFPPTRPSFILLFYLKLTKNLRGKSSVQVIDCPTYEASRAIMVETKQTQFFSLLWIVS